MTSRPTRAARDDAEQDLGPGFATLVAAAMDGLALVDANGRFLHVNPAACRILGVAAADVVGRPAVFDTTEGAAAGAVRTARWCPPGAPTRPAQRERDLEYRVAPVTGPGPEAAAVAFRDVSETRRQERRFTAFATAAANVVDAGSLRDTLDAICSAVVHTTELAGAQILLLDGDGERLQLHGAAPAEIWPENFSLTIDRARRRGARLTAFEAFQTGRPVVRPNRKAALLADPAWEPLHEQLRGFEWEAFVSAPLRVRDVPVGALNAYYRPGRSPDEDEVAFLASMADHAAVAVEHARLLAESRGRAALEERYRLARELHDSACQQLFSLALHIRATQLTLPRWGPADEAVLRSLQTLDQLAHAALDDMRGLIFELRPKVLHDEGLVAAVRQQAASAASRVGLQISVDAPDQRLDIDADTEVDAYRLVQEALHNSVKHAAATVIRICIGPDSADPATLVLEVADDGRGFDHRTRRPGLGLTSMLERAERLGGELIIESAPGAGTVVRAVVPRGLSTCGERVGTARP
jgi:PAS domain S-box-containing protein